MVAFDRIEGLFMASFVFEGLNQRESRKSVREKLENCWKKLSADAQGIIKPKYEAAMLLLKE